jgi:phosphoserine phosphatase RsbX
MTRLLVKTGIAHCPLSGEVESGDQCVVKVNDDRTIFGVIDGLGHGADAAHAATAAASVIESFAHESADALLIRCHERLRHTRGAAITLIVLDGSAGLLEWVGAGNVAAGLFHSGSSGKLECLELLVRGGAAGVMLPSVQTSRVAVSRGDFIVVATDGLRRDFLDSMVRYDQPQELADRLLATHRTATDDALVLVASFRGQTG